MSDASIRTAYSRHSTIWRGKESIVSFDGCFASIIDHVAIAECGVPEDATARNNSLGFHSGSAYSAGWIISTDQVYGSRSMILDLFKLNGRVALVTGASRGLGQSMALGLAEAGADIVALSSTGGCNEVESLVRNAGARFYEVRCDLGQPSDRIGLIDRVIEQTGRIDILVNNAGISHRHPPEEYPLGEWNQLLEIHLNASFDLSQQAAKHMLIRGRGKIINIGSVMTFEGGLNIPAYAAAKHGLAGLTKSLANSWGKRGINVNCICPGYFETSLSHVLQDDPVRGPQILDRIPVGRWGQPDELAGLCVFLASDASNYMHGSTVVIDGGWLAR